MVKLKYCWSSKLRMRDFDDLLALRAALCGRKEPFTSQPCRAVHSMCLWLECTLNNSVRWGGRLRLGGNEPCVRGEGSREVLGVTDAAVEAACVFVLFCVWLRGSACYWSVVAWVLSDLIMSESGNHYPPSYIHKSVNLNLI